jgi:hypothetical protein
MDAPHGDISDNCPTNGSKCPMSGILEIAPAGIPEGALRQPPTEKNRSIVVPAAYPRITRGMDERSVGQRMFAKAADFFRRLMRALRADVPAPGVRQVAQDRAIAEQDSDIAPVAFIPRISAVPGAARAAIREKAAMSPVVAHAAATHVVTAAKARGDLAARTTWRLSLPQLLSRLRRALHVPSVPVTDGVDGILEVTGARSAQWLFVPQAREFAVSRRLQSGGRVRAPRSSQVLRS